MSEAFALQLVLWLPFAGMLALIALPASAARTIRSFTFWVMVLQFVLTA